MSYDSFYSHSQAPYAGKFKNADLKKLHFRTGKVCDEITISV